MARLKHILITLLVLLSSFAGLAQSRYVIDEVCVGADRYYRVDGEPGSTYTWTLTEPDGITVITLPETADSVHIVWNYAAGPGTYSLATEQQNPVTGCTSIELGDIIVHDLPIAYAGPDQSLCSMTTYDLAFANAEFYSTLLWTTSGDGTFSDPTVMQPTYTFGPNDIATGSVTLTLTAQGLGYSGSCPPAESPVIITLDNILVDANIIPVSCSGVGDGTVQLTATGGFEPYSYTLNTTPPVTNGTGLFTGLAAGNYTYLVTDNLLCEATGEVFVTEPDPLDIVVTYTPPSVYGASDATATATVTGGTPPYSYLWDDPLAQTTQTAINLVAGTYNVMVTDDNGCPITGTVTIIDPLLVTINVDQNATCYGVSNGQATATVVGGIPPYTYLWDDPLAQTTGTATNLPAGTWTVTVTDATGTGIGTQVVTITQPDQIIVTIISSDPTTLGGNDGWATANATGGTPPYTYEWDDPAFQTTQTAINLTAGTYNVRVFDVNGCDGTAQVTLMDPPAPLAVTIDSTNVTCYGYNDGTATAYPTGGVPPYSYLWDDPLAQTSQTASGLAPGTYHVIVTDNAGSITTGTVTIEEPEELDVIVSQTDPTVPGGNDGTATANVTGGTLPYSYLWDDSLAQTTQTATGLTAGTYNVTVTDANGCTDAGTVTLVDPPAGLYVTVIPTDISCFGEVDGEAFADVTGGVEPYSFLWDDPLAQTTQTATNLVAGTYTVIVTDALGDVAINSGVIIEPAQLVVGITGTTPTTVGGNDGTATAIVSGGTAPYTYLWDDPLAQTTQTATGLSAGTYTVVVTDDHGCTESNTITLTDPVFSVGFSVKDVTCYGGSDGEATALPSGGTPPYSYLWSNGQTTQTATNLVAGDYSVIVTDDAGNIIQATITVDQPEEIVIVINGTNPTVIGGNDGSATANVSGGTPPYSYLWNDPLAQTTQTATGLTAGTYTVTVTDANGCTAEETIILFDPSPELVVVITKEDVSCFGFPDGEATANVSGGVPPYTYLWNDPLAQTTPTATGLASGTYMVTVTDQEGTVVQQTVEILEPVQLYAEIDVVHVTCSGNDDGSITFNNVSGGSGFYEFSILPGQWQTGPDFQGLAGGTYYPVIRDAQNIECYFEFPSETISEGTPIIVTIQQQTNVTCNTDSGEIVVGAEGGAGNYQYMLEGITPWQSSNTFSGLNVGDYTVKVKDNAGCETTFNQVITIEAIEPVDITGYNIINPSINGEPFGEVEIFATGPAEPIVYSLSLTGPWQSDNILRGMINGIFTAYAMDANGCIDSIQFTMVNVVLAEIILSSERVEGCIAEIKMLDVAVYKFDSINSFILQMNYDPYILKYTGLGFVHPALSGPLTVTETTPGTLEISYTDADQVSIPDGELLLQLRVQGMHAGVTQFHWDWLKCVVTSPYGLLPPPTAVVNNYAEVFANPDLVAYQDSTFCAGDSTTLYAETHASPVSFEWRHPRGLTHTGPTWPLGSLSVLDAGIYIVEAGHDGCSSRDSVNIMVHPTPEVFIAYTDTLCFGMPVLLDPGDDFNTYEWNTGSTLPSIIAYEPGVYWVKVTDPNNCRAIDSVELVPCVIDVLVPNAFTPNNDGLNDDFKPLFTGFEPQQYRMDIYSKWGQLIFTTNEVSHGWDGTVEGVLVDPDTFVYVISYEVPSYVFRMGLKSPITGRVSVIR